MIYDFYKINWGSDEGKGDENLSKYFIRIPDFDEIKTGEKRYIVGRKGTGKTAIIEQVINEIDGTHDNFYKELSLKDFPLQSIRNMKDRSLGEKAQFVPIWTFLILNEIVRLVIRDQSSEPHQDIYDLRCYMQENFSNEIGFVETIKKLESNQNKLAISPKWFNVENTESSSQEVIVTVHYQRINTLLIDKLKNIKSISNYYIFFDELDEGYSAGDSGLRLILLALLRAIENCFISLNKSINFRPLLALRSDIFDNLEDNDLNKLDDYVIRLKWTTESRSPYSLLDLVNARISASVNHYDDDNKWTDVALDDDPKLPNKIESLWRYILNRTFERPRDVVKFLKYCSKLKRNGKLDFEAVSLAEMDYSDWFYRELRDEIQSHLTVWKESIECIIKLNKGIFSIEEIKKEFEEDSAIKQWLEDKKRKPEDILRYLYDFGVIGNLNNNKKWFFKYKDHNLAFNPKHNMLVHFGFTRKFRIRAH